jgi:gliding motility-associated-like protein
MFWFPAKSAQFTSEDAISLSSHLSDFNYSEAGVKQLIVAPKSEFGCIGDTTLVSIKVIETDSSATKFIGSADSLLLCVGDDVAPLRGSIDVVLYDKNAKWYWFEKGQKIPVNTLEGLKLGTSKFTPTNAMENPRYDTERPFTRDYQVVRVDGNSCASRPSDFKLIVGDSIHSTPFIGDTVTLDYTGTAKLIELCAGEHPFNKDVLPVKASVNGFSMEAVKKDNIADDCDTTRKYTPKWYEWNNKINDTINLSVEKVGVSFYCIRQQTPVGCYGPWVNITILVHDSLTEKPTVEAVELCQLDNSLEVSKLVTNPTQYNVHYYDAGKNKIDISEAVIETDEPGEFLSDLKNNLFYVSLYDAETKCEGKLVGLDVSIHQKPQRPIVTKDSLYYCTDNQTVDLAEASGTTIYPSDKHTKLVWMDSESVVADKRKQEEYFVHQIDTLSGCVSEQDTVTIFVEKTFDYVPFTSMTVCYGEVVDLWTMVSNAITYNRIVITTADPQFSIQPLLGETPQAKLTEAEASQIVSLKQPTEESIQRYLITVYDKVSGCHQTDTAQIRFKALPKLEKIDPVTKCQEEEFVLPTPNSDYQFVWQFSDGTTIVDSTHFSLYESDVLTLVATTEDMPFCVDSTHFTININEVPELPLVSDITLCQGTGKHSISYEKVGSAENPVENIVFMWKNEAGEVIPQYDTEKTFEGKSLKEKLFGVVSNTYTKCESSEEITVTMLQAITLGIDDPAPLCQPETFDAATYIQQYVSSEAMTIGGNEPVITDFYSMEGETVKMSADEMSSLSFSKNADAVKYAYKMVDVQGVCSAIDTFVVTIHPKPAQPLIEKGEDSLFFCQDNAPLVVLASDTSYAKNRKLVWQNGVTGLEYTLEENLPTQNLQAYFKDTVTSCESELSKVVAVVASPIVTRPIGGSDTLVYCAGDVVDLWSMAYNSFVVDLKHRSSFVVTNVKKGIYNVPQSVLEALTSTVQDTSTYLFEVVDTLTKCTATNLVTVIFHQLPDFIIEGETAICDNGSIALNVAGDERPISYEWFYGDVLQSTSPQYKQAGLTVDTTLRIVGSLQDLPRCKTEVSHFIDVMPNPEKLQEMQIDVCQDTTGAPIAVNFNRDSRSISAYSIRWFNEQGDTLQMDENLMQPITQEGVYLYKAELIDKNTLCVGPKSTMTVKVNPQIRIHWNDPDTICQPFTYNLMEALGKSVYGGTNPRYQFTLSDGDTISNETAIAENSKLKVYYKDDNGCELVQPVSVQFFKQPQTPTLVGDTIVCQSIGDVYLSAKKNGTNTLHQTFLWKAKSSERLGDSLELSTENFGTTDYELLSVDTLTHCYSEPTSFTFDVRKKISYSPVGLLESCHNVPVDLPNKVEANYFGSDEEKHFAYFSISPTGSVSSLSQPDNILKSGNYLVKVSEKESKCERMDTVTIVVYDSLAVSIEGTTVICQENVVPDLKALNAETYIWRRANGIESEGKTFPFADAVAESETFRLIGEKKMGTLFCQDSIDVMITVNENPQSLMDTSIVFCQDSTATAQPISMNRSTENIAGFSIGWYDSDDNLLSTEEEITVSINKSGIQNYQVRLTNKITGCISKPTKVEVKVNPQIVIDWTNPDTICPPNTFNLIENLSKSVWGGTHPTYQFTTFGNEKIANETAIDKSGIYTVHYTDDNACDMSYKVNVQFFDRPKAPAFTADTTVCQGIGEVVVSASKNGVNTLLQTFEWTSPNAVFVGDELAISTDHYGVTTYEVRAIDTLSHCTSEPVFFNFDVRQKIGYRNIGLMESCYNVPVDLKSVAEKAYFGNSEEKLLSYLKISNNGNVLGVADPSQVLASGRYVVRVNETESGCFRADTVEIAVYDSIGVSVEGPLTICQGDEVEGLVGVNADTYTWRRAGSELESEVFPFATSVAQSETFRLIGEKKIGSLYCQDSIDVNITVNENPQTLPDTVLQFCQFEGGADASVKLDKLAREGESLQLVWMDGADSISSPNDELKISVQNDTAFTYYFKQVNTLTKCESNLSKATVTIYPQIRIALRDTTTCDPNIINLVNLANGKANAKDMTPRIEAQQYFLLENGDRTDVTASADRLNKSGVYEVKYSYQVDDLVCSATDGLRLTFNRQPQKPVVADQSFCQNTGEKIPVGKSSASNLRLVWEDLSSYPSKVDTLQTVVSTAIASEKEYYVRQVQDLSGCVSENALVKIHIYPSIEATSQDTSVCFGNKVDLDDMAQRNYHGGTEKFSFSTQSKEGQTSITQVVGRSGSYVVYYADSANVCRDTAEINVYVDEEILLAFDAPTSLCSGDDLTIKVVGAETYSWSTGAKSDVITVPTTTMEDKHFIVTGMRAFRDIFCQADAEITVPVYESVHPMSLTFDTCYGNPVYLQDIVSKYGITEQVDTIKNITDRLTYSTTQHDLSKSGEYELYVRNQYGCKAVFPLTITSHKVENLLLTYQQTPYCYGDSANFKVSSDNASKYEWISLNDDAWNYEGSEFNEPLTESGDFLLISTENTMGCKDTTRFSVEVYKPYEIEISGVSNVCAGNPINLEVANYLNQIKWQFADTVIIGEKNIQLFPEKAQSYRVSGFDIHNCLVQKDGHVEVAHLAKPKIFVENSTIENPDYQLDRENLSVSFHEVNTPNGSSLYTYYWDFGFGVTEEQNGNNMAYNTYTEEQIRPNKDIEVRLIVRHEYGCEKSDTTFLKIDPNIFVPNTMYQDGEYRFMKGYDVQIFDRVGTLIYEGADGWDGTYKGTPATEDTYFYVLVHYINGEKQIKTGYITLVY